MNKTTSEENFNGKSLVELKERIIIAMDSCENKEQLGAVLAFHANYMTFQTKEPPLNGANATAAQ